jgi:hypothetical protein
MSLKETKWIRPGTDVGNCAWILFPCGREFLLPIVARSQTMTPIFHDDGGMEMVVNSVDPEVDAFFDLVSTVKDKQIVIQSAKALQQFFGVLRKLLMTTNDLPADELKRILTMTNLQMGQLFNAVLLHVMRL